MSPAETGTEVTVPAVEALIDSSIFMASMTRRTSPVETESPSATFTSTTVPGMVLTVEPGSTWSPGSVNRGTVANRMLPSAPVTEIAPS